MTATTTLRWRPGRRVAIAVFLAPALLFYVLLTIYPVVQTIVNSVFEIPPRAAPVFVGGKHYAGLLDDRTFWLAVRHTVTWAVVAPAAEVLSAGGMQVDLYDAMPSVGRKRYFFGNAYAIT